MNHSTDNKEHTRINPKTKSSRIGANEIHIWTGKLDFSTNNLNLQTSSNLTESEKNKAKNIRFSKDRTQYLFSHDMLRVLIRLYGEPEAASSEFITNRYGKPFIQGSNIEFNLSHSGNIAMAAFSINIPLGIDVEKKRDDFDFMAIGKRFFTPKEYLHIESAKNPRDCFFRYWTSKEAIIKAIGQGLSTDLTSFSIPSENSKPHTITWANSHRESLTYKLIGLPISNGYSAALAYQTGSAEVEIKYFDLVLRDFYNLSKI